jgi:hypothetical protein
MTPCQQGQQPGLISYEETIERDEAPDLACSDVTASEDVSPIECTTSHDIDRLNSAEGCTVDILNCNIIWGFRIRRFSNRGMETPFAATIPFRYDGLETRPLSKK